MEAKNVDFNEVLACENNPLHRDKAFLMKMYREAESREKPLIVECGTERGVSTAVYAEACERNGGKLVTIDFNDCSDVVTSDVVTYVQSDDSKVDYILDKAPEIKEQGIDILYIDSRHVWDHVLRVFLNFYPYLNAGSVVFFDDIDGQRYRYGEKKDKFQFELQWDLINQLTRWVLYANQETMFLEHHYGFTGLAKLTKLSPKGAKLNPPKRSMVRRYSMFSRLYYGKKVPWLRKYFPQLPEHIWKLTDKIYKERQDIEV